MTFLLDTHTLLWWLTNSIHLSSNVSQIIREPEHRILMSPASAWEIATKYRLGKLPLPEHHAKNLIRLPGETGFEILEISWEHSIQAGSWPQEHRDPFDRLLAAQSYLEEIPLLSSDPTLDTFEIERIW